MTARPLEHSLSEIVGQALRLRGLSNLPFGYRQSIADAASAVIVQDDGMAVGGLPPRSRAIIPTLDPTRHLAALDDDLEILDAVCTALLAAAAAGFFYLADVPASNQIAAATATAISMFKIVRRVDRRSSPVDAIQYQILVALQEGGPLTTRELVARLETKLRTDHSKPWDESLVERELLDLTRCNARDGSSLALVRQLEDGRWTTVGMGTRLNS
jgi:hypothetical protein